MIKTVIKRDGRQVDFNKDKIKKAILKAMKSADHVDETVADKIATEIENSTKDLSVEDIQDLVERKLMASSFKDVAKRYILYREQRSKDRLKQTKLMKTVREKLSASNVQNQNANIDEYSFGGRKGEAMSSFIKQIALDYVLSPMSRNNHLSNEIYIHDLDSYLEAGAVHNCLSIPFDDLLSKGFKVKQTDVRPANSINTALQLVAVIFQLQSLQQFGGVSATHLDWTMVPYIRKSFAKHYKDGLEYICEISEIDREIENMLNNAKDYSIEDSKYIQYNDKAYKYALNMTIKECDQAVEGMYHNLNTLQSRSGNQLPFTSINYGTCTLPEGRIVIKALLNGSIKGVGKVHKTAIFPCGIFQCKKGINRKPGDPNYDLFKLALRSTAQRLYPNYANCDWSRDLNGIESDIKHKIKCLNDLSESQMKILTDWVKKNRDKAALYKMDIEDGRVVIEPTLVNPNEIVSTMGCRTYNSYDINFDFNVVLNSIIETGEPPKSYLYSGNQKDGRGNICPVTIILPTLAMQCRKSFDNDVKNGYSSNDESILIDRFIHLLDKKINEAKDMLIERFNLIAAQTPDIAKFMYENNTMSGWDGKDIGSALKHGTLAIGQIGLAETLQILIGCDHTTEKGMNLAKNIESLFQQRCAEFKETYKLNFGNYFTPAENLCYTAMQKFKDKYGIIPNVSDRDYFTNSIHVPVWKDVNAFSKIDIESQLTGYSSAGCITYIELDSGVKNNLDALETIVNYAMDKDIPYFAVNVPNDTCLDCGYCDEFNDHCPECQSENIEQLRRVTGYLSTDYRNFNKGKQKEVLDRIKHSTK